MIIKPSCPVLEHCSTTKNRDKKIRNQRDNESVKLLHKKKRIHFVFNLGEQFGF